MVKKNINLVDLGVGIKRVKKISKGGVLMEVNSIKDFKKLELEVNTNELLRENFTIKKGAKLKPKIIIYGINEDITDEEVIMGLEAQNEIPENSGN